MHRLSKRHASRGCLLLLVLLGAASPAVATQPLEDFLSRAEAQSFEAREASATERQRDREADVALGRLIPSLTARGVYTRAQREVSTRLPNSPERLVITPLNQVDALLQLDVPIIDLSNYHRYHAAKALARSASAQRGATTIDVSRSVARAYFQFVGASALVRSAHESINAAEANRKNVEDRKSAGAATELDHERALANAARAQQDLADAELGVALSARSLESLSGLTPAPADTFPEDDLHAESPLAGWMALASRTPQGKVAGHLRDAAEQNRKAASRAILPTLSASAQERFSNATGFGGEASTYSLQLILSWRLDYGVRSGVAAQDAALEVQQVRLERTERAALDAAFEAYQRVLAGIAKSQAARAQLRAASRAADLATERYSIGAATQLDVTQAQREAFLAKASQIQADADLSFARAALRLAAGVPLSQRSAARAGDQP
jgi:outer membrane protein TolC